MEMIRAVGALFAIAFGLWGIPAVWEHWSRERRLAARIERQGKVIDRVHAEAVIRTLERDNKRAAIQLAAIRRVPLPKHVVVNAVFAFGLYLSLLVFGEPIAKLAGLSKDVAEPGDWVARGVVVLISFYLTGAIVVLFRAHWVVRHDRANLIRLRFPDHFEATPADFLSGTISGLRIMFLVNQIASLRRSRRRRIARDRIAQRLEAR